jgi:glycosyltransferase involved in cell wall biosynthesis
MKICIQALTDGIKVRTEKTQSRRWGDYWFKRHMRGAFESLGHLYSLRSSKADASLLLQGKFITSKAPVKSVWICGNVERIAIETYRNYFNLVYTLSDKYTALLRERGVQCTTMWPATTAVYEPLTDEPQDKIIYMGSIKQYEARRADCLVALGKSEVCPVEVVGEGWKRFHKQGIHFIRGYVHNKHYRDLFSQYKLGVYIHARDMCQWDFVALRILDMMATGSCLVICDYNKGMKDIFGDIVPMFRDLTELKQQVQYFLKNENERKERWAAARAVIEQKHLLVHRAARMVADYENLLS